MTYHAVRQVERLARPISQAETREEEELGTAILVPPSVTWASVGGLTYLMYHCASFSERCV